MKIIATVALLQLCLSATVSDNVSTETVQTAEPGAVVRLPCNSTTPASVRWMKDGLDISPDSADGRLTVLQSGSLEIKRMGPDDEGIYLCSSSSTLPDSDFRSRVQLRMASGPKDLSTLIYPVIRLSNGTLVAKRDDFIYFQCSASSQPSQRLTWTFSGANTLNSTSQSSLEYNIKSIQPSDQGVYTCGAINTVSNHTANKSSELLVYYLPATHPDCMSVPTPDLSSIQLNCSWSGMYPTPTLSWGQNGDAQETNSLSMMLNSSLVNNEKMMMEKIMMCTAQHALLPEGVVRSCSIKLKAPYPVGQPMAAALEGSNVTLICIEVTSVPTANTTWRKGLKQTLITPGSKYILSGNSAVFRLTITNASKDDEDVYFCRSENQFGVVELQVQLSVKSSSSAYVGGVIGVFLSFLIVGSAIVIARVLYSRRHQICLGGGLWDDERGDVLSLVESDDEQFFQDTVPQLPTEANGRLTTLVEIHHIPSSDHEETETADKKPQQPEESEQTEQSEDLVPI